MLHTYSGFRLATKPAPVVKPSLTLAHDCSVLQLDTWLCDDCGKIFDRDPNMGDYPETAIIEGECEYTLDQEEWEAMKRWGMSGELGGEG